MSAGLFVAGLAAAGYALFDGAVVDMGMLSYLQAGAGVLGVASKLPQILAVYQQGGTGQLSAFAVSPLSLIDWCDLLANACGRSSITWLGH